MSIGITCNLSDGVILGADSAITVMGKTATPAGIIEGVVKVYNDAEKVFQLLNSNIGIVTCGIAMLGSRTLKSYISEFEYEFTAKKLEKTKLHELCKLLYNFFSKKYEEAFKQELEAMHGKKYEEIPNGSKPPLLLGIAGFSHDEYLSEVYEVKIPAGNETEAIRFLRNKGQFGTNWFGQNASIKRLIKGFDENILNQLLGYLVNKFKLTMDQATNDEIMKILQLHEHRIPYDAMPLQEGIDHVKFLLDVVINETKFVIGAPTCGGNIRIAAIDREKGFRFVTDNELKISVL